MFGMSWAEKRVKVLETELAAIRKMNKERPFWTQIMSSTDFKKWFYAQPVSIIELQYSIEFDDVIKVLDMYKSRGT